MLLLLLLLSTACLTKFTRFSLLFLFHSHFGSFAPFASLPIPIVRMQDKVFIRRKKVYIWVMNARVYSDNWVFKWERKTFYANVRRMTENSFWLWTGSVHKYCDVWQRNVMQNSLLNLAVEWELSLVVNVPQRQTHIYFTITSVRQRSRAHGWCMANVIDLVTISHWIVCIRI